MYETKYYSLIDMNSSGTLKTALIPTKDESLLKKSGKPYLEEVVPFSFWLHSDQSIDDAAIICCPVCGRPLTIIAGADGVISNTIYQCIYCK